MNEARDKKTVSEPEFKPQVEKQVFKSGFKAWIRIVAFIVVAVFLPEQVAQAVEYDWRVLWQKPALGTTFAPSYLKDIRQIDIPLTIKNILQDIAGKPINAIQISPNLTIELEKPLDISKQRIEEIYNWLKGKPCGSKALYDYLNYKGLSPKGTVPAQAQETVSETLEQDVAVMALTIDILNGIVKPEGNPEIIKNSLYALSKTSEFFGHKLYPVKIQGIIPSEAQGTVPETPFIAHLKGDHYILVTKINNEKVYYLNEHKEEFWPQEKFFSQFTGYALVTNPDSLGLISDSQAKKVLGAGEWGGDGGSTTNSGVWVNSDGREYGGGNYYVPAGYAPPVMPSFSSNNITPFYHFTQPMYANNLGFTNTTNGNFVNPVGIGYTFSSNAKNPLGSIPIWFNNGLDGVTFRHDDIPTMTAINSDAFAKTDAQNLGLNNVWDTRISLPIYDQANVAVDSRNLYVSAAGIPLTYHAYQSVDYINEQLFNMANPSPQRPSPADYARTSPAPYTYNAYTLGNGEAVLALNKPGDHFSWNYQTGAYMKSGDKYYGTGRQELVGIGSNESIQKLAIRTHPDTRTYEGTIGNLNNGVGPIPTTGLWDISRQGTVSLNAGNTILKGNTATVLDNYLQANYSPNLRVEHWKIEEGVDIRTGDIKKRLMRTISAGEGPLAVYTSNGVKWINNLLVTKVSVNANLDGTDYNSNANLLVTKDDIIEGYSKDMVYHAAYGTESAIIEAFKNQKPEIQRDVVKKGILDAVEISDDSTESPARETRTEELFPYVYRSQFDSDQHAFNLNLYDPTRGVILDTAQGVIDNSPMFHNIRHTFTSDFTDNWFIAGVQTNEKTDITGSMVAAADYNPLTDNYEPLKGKTVDLNAAGLAQRVKDGGFVGQALSGWNNITALGNHFVDLTGTDKIEARKALMKGVSFAVAGDETGEHTWLSFSMKDFTLPGGEIDNWVAGLDERGLPQIRFDGYNPFVLNQTQAPTLNNDTKTLNNIGTDYDRFVYLTNENGITYAFGQQNLDFQLPLLNSTTANLSGDFRGLSGVSTFDGDAAFAAQLNNLGVPVAKGGLDFTASSSVFSFDEKGILTTKHAGYWQSIEGRQYTALFQSAKGDPLLSKLQGQVRWDVNGNLSETSKYSFKQMASSNQLIKDAAGKDARAPLWRNVESSKLETIKLDDGTEAKRLNVTLGKDKNPIYISTSEYLDKVHGASNSVSPELIKEEAQARDKNIEILTGGIWKGKTSVFLANFNYNFSGSVTHHRTEGNITKDIKTKK